MTQQIEQGAPQPNFIWRLVPIDLKSQNWEASTFKGELIVRACDESEARQIASLKFFIETERRLGQNVSVNPWRDPTTVSCTRTSDSEHIAEGPSAILQRKGIS